MNTQHWTDYYSDEQIVRDPRLYKCGVRIYWQWFWFRWMLGAMLHRPAIFYWFMNVRMANARGIYVGPIHIVIPRPWLPGPARDHLKRYADPPK